MNDVITKFDPEFLKNGYVDAHVHVWTADTKAYPLAPGHSRENMQPLSFTPEQLFVHTVPSGISRIVLIQMSYYQDDNSYMVDMMRRYRGVFGGVGIVNAQKNPREAMLSLARDGVKGFRITANTKDPDKWLDGDGMASMWKTGSEHGLAMCPLINPEHLPAVDRMCHKHPETPVVIDHVARIGVGGKRSKKDIDQLCALAKHKRAMVKISAFYAISQVAQTYSDLGPLIKRLLDAFGPERLMWASDGPFQMMGGHNCKESVELIRSGLDFLSDSDRDWLLRKSAESFFFST